MKVWPLKPLKQKIMEKGLELSHLQLTELQVYYNFVITKLD